MQGGDLSAFVVSRMVLVLEGVLASVDEETSGVLRKTTTRSYSWYETPLKRLVYLKSSTPDLGIDVITFLSQDVADHAADFFARHDIPVDSCQYASFSDWTWSLRLHPEIVAIYDSDTERLHQYGQRGVGILLGQDF